MFELGPGLQHPSEQLAVLEKRAGLRSHTFPPVLSTVGPEPPDPRAGRGTPGHPREGCGLGLAPWGWRSRRPFPRVFLRRISEGRAPRGGGTRRQRGSPGASPRIPPTRAGEGAAGGSAAASRRRSPPAPGAPISAAPQPPALGAEHGGDSGHVHPSVRPSVRPRPDGASLPTAATGGPAGGPGGGGAPGPGTPCPGTRTSAGPTGREGLSRADSYSGRPSVVSRGEDGPKDVGWDVSCSV